MNLGIQAAGGKYIGIVETDDFIDKNMFYCLYALAEKYDVDFVKSGYKQFVTNETRNIINYENARVLSDEYINKKFDCIISNPPYISKNEKIMDIVYNNEPHLALFADNNGLYFYEEIIKNAKNILKDKYLICFEIGESEAKSVTSYAHKYLDNPKVIVKKDLEKRDRMIFIHNFE